MKKKLIITIILITSELIFAGTVSSQLTNTPNKITIANSCMPAINGIRTLQINYFNGGTGAWVPGPDNTVYTAYASVNVTTTGSTVVIDASASSPAANFPDFSITKGTLKIQNGSVDQGLMEWEFDQINCFALPITLYNFNATSPQGCTVTLNWQTAMEQNTTYFEMQRSSTGNNYYKIGQVQAAGNSEIPKSYQLVDAHPDAVNFYRIKELDLDGRCFYFYCTNPSRVLKSGCSFTKPNTQCNISITGPTAICSTGSPAVYTLSTGLPIYSTGVSWNVTPSSLGSLSVNACDNSKVVFTPNSKAVFLLSATVNGCTNVISKSIGAGNPQPAPTVTVSLDCPDGSAFATNAPGATSYTWHLVNSTTHQETIYSNYGASINFRDLTGTHNIGAAYNSSCGTSDPGVIYNVFCSSGSNPHVVASPNPSSGHITVSIPVLPPSSLTLGTAGAVSENKIYQIKVISPLGNIEKMYSYPEGRIKADIDLSGLKNGVYTLQVYNKVNWKSQQIIISK